LDQLVDPLQLSESASTRSSTALKLSRASEKLAICIAQPLPTVKPPLINHLARHRVEQEVFAILMPCLYA
jgi:hypothetical protein